MQYSNNTFTCSLIALIVTGTLTACGGSDKETTQPAPPPPVVSTNQTPVANISGASVMNERSQITFDGSSSTDSDGSISSYSWSIERQNFQGTGLDIQDNGNALTLVVNEVADDQTIDINLTVTDNDGASSSSLISLIIEEVDRDRLPPMPVNGAETLVGVDSDSDGVRDDIEIAILERYPLSITNREISRRAAEIYTEALNAGEFGDDIAASAASERMAFLVACYFDQSDMDVSRESGLLEALILNTTERLMAWDKFNLKLAGKVQRTVDSDPVTCLLPQKVGA